MLGRPVAGLAHPRIQAEIGDELARRLEATDVADRAEHSDRGDQADARQRHQPQRVGVADRVSAEDLVELIDLAAGEVDLAQAGLHRQLLIERQLVQALG